ncbi:MAG: hypothetical protein IPK25_19755 [Saprospiraceae bacterium]|nr:hypothetical protein [Saprospiraceae bacterium]
MREYEEGILLFEVTKMKVWDKANQDSVGLEQFYNDNKIKYIGEEIAKTTQFIIHTQDQKLAEKILKYARKNSSEKVLTKFNKSTGVVTIMDENFEKSHPLMKDIVWKLNESTPMIHNTQAKHFTFRKIVEIKASKTKTLGEARGYVVADYQDFLEKQWVKELKKEFQVIVNKPVFTSMIK